MEAAPPVEDLNPRPAMRERWMSALPMFFCFVLIALAARIVPKFDEMFREMELGSLPVLTQLLFSLCASIRTMPWFFTAAMFAVAWLYFTWVAEDRRRISWFKGIAWLLFAVSSGSLVVALFLPLMITMGPINK